MVFLFEDLAELRIISFGNRVFGAKPHVKFLVIGIGEAGFGEACYGFVGVVDALDYAWTFEVLDGSTPKFLASCVCEDHFGFSCFRNSVLAVFVNVAVGVSADVDRFLP